MTYQSYAADVLHHPQFDPNRLALVYCNHPLNPALREDVQVTYGDLRDGAAKCAGFLKELGVGKGDRVIVLVPLGQDLYEIILGLMQVGAVLVFLDAWTGLQDFDRVCDIAQAKAFIGISKAHGLRLASRHCARIPIKIFVDAPQWWRRIGIGGYHYEDLRATATPEVDCVAVAPEDPMMVAFTTRSSGRPKGCVRSDATVRASLSSLADMRGTLGLGTVDGVSHSAEMMLWPGVVMAAFPYQMTAVVPAFEQGKVEQADYPFTLQLIKTYHVEAITASPVFYEKLVALATPEHQAVFDQIRMAAVGGASVAEHVFQQMARAFRNAHVYTIYGSTECEPVSILTADESETLEPAERFGFCVGTIRPELSGHILPVVDGPMTPAHLEAARPCGGIGEIVVSGPQVTTAYWQDEQAFAENKIEDDDHTIWHRLGDIGYFDDAQRIWLVGRRHNIVVKPDRTLYPAEVEPPLEALPDVKRAGLVSYEPPDRDRPQAVVVLECDPDTAPEPCIEQAMALNEANYLGVDQFLISYKLPIDPRHNTKIDTTKLSHSVAWHNRTQRSGPVISATALTEKSPFFKRLWAYLQERYDPIQGGVTTLALSLGLVQTFRHTFGVEWSGPLIAATGLLTIMQWFFYLLLRVFDEHKDWDTDHINFPERILSRGLVTLTHMKWVGLVCTLVLFTGSLWFGPPMLVYTGILYTYALLMLKEFFVAEWLKRHLLLYGISHNVIVFLSFHWIFAGFARVSGVEQPWTVLSLSLFAVAINSLIFSLEVARKIRLPEFEREGVDTYSQVIGYQNSAWLAVGIQALGLILLYSSAPAISHYAWFGLLIVFAGVAGLVVKFLRAPDEKTAEKLANPCALTLLATLFALTFSL